MSYDQEYYNRAEVVADGKVEVLIDEFITRAFDGPCTYTIMVKQGTTVVHELTITADEIELVRL